MKEAQDYMSDDGDDVNQEVADANLPKGEQTTNHERDLEDDDSEDI